MVKMQEYATEFLWDEDKGTGSVEHELWILAKELNLISSPYSPPEIGL